MARTKFQEELTGFIIEYEEMMESFSAEIKPKILAGAAVAATIDAAVVQLNMRQRFGDMVLDYAEKGALKGGDLGITASAFRTRWLNLHWPGDKITFSQRTTKWAKMTDLKNDIRLSMRNKKSWIETARSLSKKDLLNGDVAGYMQKLERSARRLMQGDATAINEYKKYLKAAKRNVERLAQKGVASDKLKKAYQNVIKHAQGTSEKALSSAFDRSVIVKARYNGERIARTEIARAYGQGFYADALQDNDVIGIRWALSSAHSVYDICDFHASANIYGMGAGVSPKSSVPPYPAHPHCRCLLENVYRGETNKRFANDFDNKQVINYIKGVSVKRQKQLLGVAGQKLFTKQPKMWKNLLKNWNGHSSVHKMLNNKFKS